MVRDQVMRGAVWVLLCCGLAACKPDPSPHDEIQKHLDQQNPRRVDVDTPRLCQIGPEGRAVLTKALRKLPPGKPAGVMRLYGFHTLRCLRMKEVGLDLRTTDPGEALNVDRALDVDGLALMIAAYRDEPRAAVRARMFERVRDLDAFTRYALYAGMASVSHDIPIRADQEVAAWTLPYGLSDALAQSSSLEQRERLRKMWCREVAPVAKARFAKGRQGKDELFNSLYFMTMLDNDCGDQGEETLRLYLSRLDGAASKMQFGRAVPGVAEVTEREALRLFGEAEREVTQGPAQWPDARFVLRRVLATSWDGSRGSPHYIGVLLETARSCGVVHRTLAVVSEQLQKEPAARKSPRMAQTLRPWLRRQRARCPISFRGIPEHTRAWIRAGASIR